jgi:hypothetical protein
MTYDNPVEFQKRFLIKSYAIDIIYGQICGLETKIYSLNRKPGGILLAVESFLRGSSNDPAIFYQARC